MAPVVTPYPQTALGYIPFMPEFPLWASGPTYNIRLAPVEPEFPISTLSLRENHTPATLSCQIPMDMAALGSYRGSFGSFADLFGLFLASSLPDR